MSTTWKTFKKALVTAAIVGSATAAALFVGYTQPAEAIERIGWSKSRETMYIHGQIEVGDGQKIADVINRSRKNLRGIILDSPGGDVREGALLMDLIKNRDFDTGVAKGSVCASSCFMLWAAGRNRFLYADSQIGIHSASTLGQNGLVEESEYSMKVTLLMARAYVYLNVPLQLIGAMVITPPTGVYWLTNDDLVAMNARVMQ
jgi:hypothetical protein